MAGYPSAAAIQPPVTVGQQKVNLADILATAKQALGGTAVQALTIAAGLVTPASGTSGFLRIDTQAADPTDDLTQIAVTNLPEGSVLVIQAANDARTVVVKHGAGGSGQLLLATGADFSLDDNDKALSLVRVGTSWEEWDRSYGADVAALRAFQALGTAALLNSGTSPGNVPLVSNILGKLSFDIPVDGWRPTTTAGCAPHAQVELTAGQPEVVSLDFDGVNIENAFCCKKFPKHWDLGTIEARFWFLVNGAVSTTVTWGLKGVARADNEALQAAYGTPQFSTKTYHGTANRLAVTDWTPAIIIAGTPTEAKMVYLNVLRDPTVDGTSGHDGKLINVEIRYTANALNDA